MIIFLLLGGGVGGYLCHISAVIFINSSIILEKHSPFCENYLLTTNTRPSNTYQMHLNLFQLHVHVSNNIPYKWTLPRLLPNQSIAPPQSAPTHQCNAPQPQHDVVLISSIILTFCGLDSQ